MWTQYIWCQTLVCHRMLDLWFPPWWEPKDIQHQALLSMLEVTLWMALSLHWSTLHLPVRSESIQSNFKTITICLRFILKSKLSSGGESCKHWGKTSLLLWDNCSSNFNSITTYNSTLEEKYIDIPWWRNLIFEQYIQRVYVELVQSVVLCLFKTSHDGLWNSIAFVPDLSWRQIKDCR